MGRIRTLATAVIALAAWSCADSREEEWGDAPAAEPAADTRPEEAEAPPPGGTALRVDSLPGGGAYLTDGDGRALYLLEGEPPDRSTCYDECAREWPPFLAGQGPPAAAADPVRDALISTLERRDGGQQVTYDGHPLYYYHDDSQPGQTSGHDLTDAWGEWYLVRPDGGALEEGGQADEGGG